MFVQFKPELSQSCHWYAKDDGLPLQVPVLADRIWPVVVVPVIAGAVALVGAGGVTTAVAADVEFADPPELVAVTTTLTVSPTSPEVRV